VIGTDDRKLRFEGRQIFLNNFPDNFYIDVEVIVNDAMPQADDFTPPISGCWILKLSERRLAASPMISKFRTTESTVLSSFTKVS